jgi:hypothetical protein
VSEVIEIAVLALCVIYSVLSIVVAYRLLFVKRVAFQCGYKVAIEHARERKAAELVEKFYSNMISIEDLEKEWRNYNKNLQLQ